MGIPRRLTPSVALNLTPTLPAPSPSISTSSSIPSASRSRANRSSSNFRPSCATHASTCASTTSLSPRTGCPHTGHPTASAPPCAHDARTRPSSSSRVSSRSFACRFRRCNLIVWMSLGVASSASERFSWDMDLRAFTAERRSRFRDIEVELHGAALAGERISAQGGRTLPLGHRLAPAALRWIRRL